MADTDVKQQIVDKIKDSASILVTVNANPTVDELSAALGITLLINKLDKHATCVFSGEIPPAISFLDPEKTFESTVDSLRDFIISLDKEKADHLRYKVDGDVVKIFITPYRTVINQDDLDFSQGDYNVEFVIAIGVQREEDLDRALESHGRILHDATVASINLGGGKNLGDIRWVDAEASSYSEMLTDLGLALRDSKSLFDEQISTAFLTGIVAATERFSNANTSSSVMTLAARLMSTGANQQLIAAKLESLTDEDDTAKREDYDDRDHDEPAVDRTRTSGDLKENQSTKLPRDAATTAATNNDGSLLISHELRGNLDEVAEQVTRRRQEEARDEAEDELAARLAKNVPSMPPALSLLEATPPPAPAAPVLPPPQLRGAVPTDQWHASEEDMMSEPSMGGTLNATTEQAAEDKRREIESDRNRTILSHDGDPYINDTPAYQAPLNAASINDTEPEVRDIFEDTQSGASLHADMIQPPTPAAPAPTLAEIDAQNRAKHQDAMGAIEAAFEETPIPQSNYGAQPAPVAPPMPPMPMMPDFKTLPPLPPSMPPLPETPTLGNAPLPPLPELPTQPGADPSQFRIPGQ